MAIKQIEDIDIQTELKPLVIERDGYSVKLTFSRLDNTCVMEKVKEILSGTYKIAIYKTLDNKLENT